MKSKFQHRPTMNDITEYFYDLLNQHRSIDVANAEFKRQLHESPDLKTQYKDWCHAVGSSEKNGFLDWCEEYMASQDSIWETLNDDLNDE